MKYNRLHFKKKNIIGYITMYKLNYNQFFKLLDDNDKLYKEFDKHMKSDWKKAIKKSPPKSIIEMWRNNERFKKKLIVCFLVYKNKYIGSFRYTKTRVNETRMKGVNLNNKIYVKISIVYIIPEYRKLGLAYKMLSKIVSKNKCYLFVDNNNLKAYNLYKKLGFKKIGGNNNESVLVHS
jgi:ribosomal protein S18 acetylase RimI-like enzyme